MRLYYDNQTPIHIAENSVFHERKKNIKVDCHLIRHKIEEKNLQAQHVSSRYSKFTHKIS